jgi:hypothetical protein
MPCNIGKLRDVPFETHHGGKRSVIIYWDMNSLVWKILDQRNRVFMLHNLFDSLQPFPCGAGSSRDWAAKGTALLGVKAVIAQSFERIHRSNLVGMGVLPCQFEEGVSAQSLTLDGSEVFDIIGLEKPLKPRQSLTLLIRRVDGQIEEVPVMLRIDTPIEIEYYRHGGILPYVLRQLIAQA